MYKWQKPPIFPSAYASAHRSSKRRCRSIDRRRSFLSRVSSEEASAASPFFLFAIPRFVLRASPWLTTSVIRPPPVPAPTRGSWISREDPTLRDGSPFPFPLHRDTGTHREYSSDRARCDLPTAGDTGRP